MVDIYKYRSYVHVLGHERIGLIGNQSFHPLMEIINVEGSELLMKNNLQVLVAGLVRYVPNKDIHDDRLSNSGCTIQLSGIL